jgi:predicted permease
MVATLVTETAEKTTELPIPPAAFAILALAFFGLLLLVTFAFRSVGHRH